MVKEKDARYIPKQAQYRRETMPIIRSSTHLQNTQRVILDKYFIQYSGARAHEYNGGGSPLLNSLRVSPHSNQLSSDGRD